MRQEEFLYSAAAIAMINTVAESSLDRPYTTRNQKTLTRMAAALASAYAVLKIVEYFKRKEADKLSKAQIEYLETWRHTQSQSSFSESSDSPSISSLIAY